jgi:hypothetical protein
MAGSPFMLASPCGYCSSGSRRAVRDRLGRGRPMRSVVDAWTRIPGAVTVLAGAALITAQARGALVDQLGGVREAATAPGPLVHGAIDLHRGQRPDGILDDQVIDRLGDVATGDAVTGADNHCGVTLGVVGNSQATALAALISKIRPGERR